MCSCTTLYSLLACAHSLALHSDTRQSSTIYIDSTIAIAIAIAVAVAVAITEQILPLEIARLGSCILPAPANAPDVLSLLCTAQYRYSRPSPPRAPLPMSVILV